MDWINFIEAPFHFCGANSSTRDVGDSADSGLQAAYLGGPDPRIVHNTLHWLVNFRAFLGSTGLLPVISV
jgi:hypothetical protein